MNTNQYTHRYPITAADMDTRYRMTPNAVLLYYQDTIKCRLTLLPNDINGEYHYLHTMTRNETEITAQIYSEWVPRTIHHDVCTEAARK